VRGPPLAVGLFGGPHCAFCSFLALQACPSTHQRRELPGRARYASAIRQRLLRDAYLEPWTAVAPPDRLRYAFGLAWTLGPVWQAVRLHRELPYAEPDSPWAVAWAGRVPPALRAAARRLAAAG
jgi:hypothetical protein